MDKKVKRWFFYPYAVNLKDLKMGPPHPPVESWNPPLVKILFHNMKNWANNGKKSIFAILAMSQRVADILELVLHLLELGPKFLLWLISTLVYLKVISRRVVRISFFFRNRFGLLNFCYVIHNMHISIWI